MLAVTGLPRLGTSLMMQAVAAGGHPVYCDDWRPADARNPRGYFESIAERATAELQRGGVGEGDLH
jgi:hypothetical protein